MTGSTLLYLVDTPQRVQQFIEHRVGHVQWRRDTQLCLASSNSILMSFVMAAQSQARLSTLLEQCTGAPIHIDDLAGYARRCIRGQEGRQRAHIRNRGAPSKW